MKKIAVLTVVLLACSIAALFLMGTSGCGAILGGNVYSDGYRDGYITGVSLKRQGFGGLA